MIARRTTWWAAVALAAGGLGVVAGCGGGDESGVSALPAASCSPIVYEGEGEPDMLIATDLPLQGASRRQNVEMAQAAEFVLRGRNFMAGDTKIGFQSCDDSTAQAGKWDSAKCASNAQAYADNTKVAGIIGTFNSGCVALIIPVLNRAPEGPVVIVSPGNSYLGFTKAGPGTKPGEPASYYPTGELNFTRVVAADDYQGAADALLAQQLGLKNVFVLNDKELYGAGIATLMRAALEKLGIGVAGFQGWDAKGASFEALASRVAASGADGVYLGGIIDNQGGKLIKDMRAALGPDVPIIVPDGFTPIQAIVAEAGAASEGVYVTVAGMPTDQLVGKGKEFVDAFGEQVGGLPVPYAAYAAQAAEVLLDAIAASDGSRGDIAAKVFATKVTGGILGDFSFTPAGDTTANPVTVYRIVNGQQTTDRVITPPDDLVGG